MDDHDDKRNSVTHTTVFSFSVLHLALRPAAIFRLAGPDVHIFFKAFNTQSLEKAETENHMQ